MTENRLHAIINNDGYDCQRSERRRMAEEILKLREEKARQWKGNSGGAGHGNSDKGINPLYTK